jgi:putative ABC transport system permease protein
LVISQIALALVLLVSAGLFLRSFWSLQEADPGFQAEQVLAITLDLPRASYREGEQIHSFYQNLLQRVESLPGVKTVGASTDLPLELSSIRPFSIEGRPEEGQEGTGTIDVLGNYFETLETSLKSGRYFTERDRSGAERVVIINETMERRWWPGEDPLGKRVALRENPIRWMKIVGVIKDVKNGPLHTESFPQVFVPYLQASGVGGFGGETGEPLLRVPNRTMTLLVRTEMDPSTLVAAVRGEIGELDPMLPVADVQTLTQHLSRSVAPQRFNTLLLALFAVVALFLAMVGIYGVMSYVVTQRSHELGIRMALGAERKSLLRLVIGQGMTLALWGVAIGLVASFALTRLIASQLYGVTATDPLTLVGASLLFFAVALLACVVPGLKATQVDPMVALRYE